MNEQDFLRVLRVLCGKHPYQPDLNNTSTVSYASRTF